MIDRIYDFIKQYNMFAGCDRIIVGLSGGADSVCLLRVLHSIIEREKLDIRLVAVHVNHGIRGQEAARDEAFARSLCEELGVEFISESVDVPKLAVNEGMSEEEAGRKVRYAVFARCAGDCGKIAVAHHMDDQAETVLMNLFRGSGLKGMSGIAPVRDNIIRPLLCVSRQEIEGYLRELGQEYVTDSTNCENVYTRNRVRNELMPYIKDNVNSEAVRHLVEAAHQAREAQEYIDKCAEELLDKCSTMRNESCSIDLSVFGDAPEVVKAQAVVKVLHMVSGNRKDWYRKHVDAVLDLEHMQVGKCVSLPYGMRAKKTYDSIEIECELCKLSAVEVTDGRQKPCEVTCGKQMAYEAQGDIVPITISEIERAGGIYDLPVGREVYDGTDLRMLRSVRLQVIDRILIDNSAFDKKNVYTKCFDYDKIKGTLVLRFRQEGDVITVCSDGKKRKLKKEFIDRKVPKDIRDSVILLTEEDKVLWAIGLRRGQDYLVEDVTKRVLIVSLEFQEERGYGT